MKLTTVSLALSSLLATTLAQAPALPPNSTQEYNLRTCLKPDQQDKQRFENLYLYGYHTGAGENDATFAANLTDYAAVGYLSPTNITADGQSYSYQVFNLSSPFPWQMVMAENVNFYAAWEPVRINAGLGSTDAGQTGGFFINETGLQWDSYPGGEGNAFGGWLVCDWWHGTPQLFFRISYYDTPAPCSCADVNLIPEYV